MFEYPYEMISGHVVINADNRFLLLDTGAPSSIGLGSVRIGDSSYQVQDNYMGITAAYLTREIGRRIDGLIGADIIADFTMTIDTRQNKVVFGSEVSELPLSVPIDDFMGIPILKVSVNGSQIRAFFDTGARLSYVSVELSEGIVPAGQKEDFYPGIGRFITDIFELDTVIGGESFTFSYGHLPPLLQMTLMMANTQGIIGTEVLKSCICSLSLRRRELRLNRIGSAKTSGANSQSNAFIRVLSKAKEQNWCTQSFCTTCGAKDFRSALRDVGGELGGPLADALAGVDLDELTSFLDWDDALVIAIRDLPSAGQATALLESWLERAEQNIRFFDVVLYKLVRYLPERNSVRQKWIEKAVFLSIQTCDFSLIESLLLTLRERAHTYRQLIDIARGFAESSKQMRRVLRNACKLEN